jgi:hypothetical protein
MADLGRGAESRRKLVATGGVEPRAGPGMNRPEALPSSPREWSGRRESNPRSQLGRLAPGLSVTPAEMERPTGVAPVLPPWQGGVLLHGPWLQMVRAVGIAPTTSCSRSRRAAIRTPPVHEWSNRRGSHPQPPRPQRGVLLPAPRLDEWSGTWESNPDLRVQSALCYRYTSPQRDGARRRSRTCSCRYIGPVP